MSTALAARTAQAGRRTFRRPSPVLVIAVVVALVAGWFASVAWSTSAQLKIVGEASGTVSVVNVSGAKFCFIPSDGRAERCGVAYQRRDAAQLAMGDRVSVAIAQLKTSPGSVSEVFIVESTGSQ